MSEQSDVPLNIRIGLDQQLFFFHKHSPGSCFWLPNGTRLYNKLLTFMKDEYFKRGYDEVKSPIIAKKDLWEISGHWQKYKENMFCFCCGSNDETEYGIAPMNCPKHCIMFKHTRRSYKELPLRFADFGTLHRNELSGTLTSLFRNKEFHQDDSHLFCTYDQIKSEIANVLEFIKYVYSKFNFQFEVCLSTRPEVFTGEVDVWDKAESELKEILSNTDLKWNISEKDGAFYGPKIDVSLTDSIGRKHQCATIQLDFQLPILFELQYADQNNELKTPVIIHRAIYGSFERFIGILCEHYNGKFPFWLNHSPIIIIPISDQQIDYCKKIKAALNEHKYYVDVDMSNRILGQKLKDAKDKQYNYVLIAGQKEVDKELISVKYRDNDVKKVVSINELIGEMKYKLDNFE